MPGDFKPRRSIDQNTRTADLGCAKARRLTTRRTAFSKSCDLLFVLLLLLHLVPLWAFDYFPSQDGPAHVYNASIIRDYAREEFALYREFYTLEHRFGVNWLIHLLLAGLMAFFPMLIAEKVLLTAYVIVFMLSLRYAVSSINSTAVPLALLGFPLIYNRSMHMGFYSFIFSLAGFLMCIGYWFRHNRGVNPTRELMFLAGISLLLYLTHLLSLVMALTVIGILAAWFVLVDLLKQVSASTKVRAVRARGLWFFIKPKLPSLLAFAPSIVLVMLFFHDKRAGVSITGDLKIVVRQLLSFQRIEALVLGGLLGLLLLLAMLTFKDRFVRVRLCRADGFFLAGLFVSIVYVLAPDVVFGGGLIRERLLIYVMLMLILWVACQTYRHLIRLLIVGGASAVAIAGLIINLDAYKVFNDYMHEYVAAGELADPQATILQVSFTYSRRRDAGWFASTAPQPLVNVSGYIASTKRLIDLGNYEAASDHFPTAFRPHLNPYSYLGTQEDVSGLDIAGYYHRVGKHVDYVLLTSTIGVEQELRRATDLHRQLNNGYLVLYTSPRDLGRLYRRLDFKAALGSAAQRGRLE